MRDEHEEAFGIAFGLYHFMFMANENWFNLSICVVYFFSMWSGLEWIGLDWIGSPGLGWGDFACHCGIPWLPRSTFVCIFNRYILYIQYSNLDLLRCTGLSRLLW